MPKSGARKVVKPVAAAAVTLGTIASIWWFALKPRRKAGRQSGPEEVAGSPSTRAGSHSLIGRAHDHVGQDVEPGRVAVHDDRHRAGARDRDQPGCRVHRRVEPTASSRSQAGAALPPGSGPRPPGSARS